MQENIYFCFIDYAKIFDCIDHNKLENSERDGNTRPPDLPRNPYAGQEATVRTGRGTTDWFQIGQGVRQGCILPPCLFNLYAEYIMRNSGLDETQTGMKIAWRNSSNLRYTGASLVAQRLKRLPGMRKTPVRSLDQEDPLEKEMAAHSSTLAWKIPWAEEPGRLQSMGLQRVGHD